MSSEEGPGKILQQVARLGKTAAQRLRKKWSKIAKTGQMGRNPVLARFSGTLAVPAGDVYR